ncbi:MAG: anti-sigma factor [Dehalococcoidia bacterium]
MNCQQADELIGAYALDALPDAEAAELRAHIATCANHAAQAVEMRALAARMPALVEPMQPPEGLRARILEAVREAPQAQTRNAAAPRSIVRGPRRAVRAARDTSRGWRYAWGAVAAVLVAAIGGLLAWNVVLMNRLDDDGVSEFASAITTWAPLQSANGENSGMVVYFGETDEAVVIAHGISPLDASRQAYQLWSMRDGQAVSLGLMNIDESGRASMAIPYDALAADALAITIEPRDGSAQPTSDPVFIAEL